MDASEAPVRTDRTDGPAWLALGIAVLSGSLTMDRLADQDINPYTIPGLLPALLGIALVAMGSLMTLRGLRAGPSPPVVAAPRSVARTALAIALCVAFGAGLVGHGLPFWLAAALFVTVAILVLGPPAKRTPTGALTALAVGLASGWAITLIFQTLFLVRLP